MPRISIDIRAKFAPVPTRSSSNFQLEATNMTGLTIGIKFGVVHTFEHVQLKLHISCPRLCCSKFMSAQIGMAIAPEGSFLQKLGPFPTICLDLRDTNIFKILKLKTRGNICVHVSHITYTYAYNPIFKFKQKDFFQTLEEYVPKLF